MTHARADHLHVVTASFSLRRLAVSALLLICLTAAAESLNTGSWSTDSISILWPPTGLLIGILLCLPPRHWSVYIAVGFCIDLACNLLPPLRQPFPLAIGLALCNVTEVTLAARLLYPTLSPGHGLGRPKQLINLLIYGVVLAPAIASSLAALCVAKLTGSNLQQAFADWYSGDALGIAIITPLYLSLQTGSPFSRRKWYEVTCLFACLCAVSILVFWQTSLPLLFLVLPVLLLVEIRLGMAGAAMGLLAVSVIGGYFTSKGHGPIGLTHLTSLSARTLVLQLFTMVCMLVVYIAEVVRAERIRFEQNLRASELRFRLLAEESRDIITLSNLKKEIQYVSPAVKPMLGWDPQDWMPMDRTQMIHDDDMPDLERLYDDCLAGRIHNTLDFRIAKKAGGYLWVEASLALHRDPETNAPAGFINVVRDISGRKAAEDKLNKALNVAENRATVDALTGIANRRSLDERIENEWRRAMRADAVIAVLMIDIDQFKQYNDKYGHLLGDRCLKEVAWTIACCIQRSTDFLARYGGEEFVVVLPNTDASGAQLLAEQVRKAVELRKIPHEGSSHGMVTISVGCAVQTPKPGLQSTHLLMMADEALYQAKWAGRNCVRPVTELALANAGHY